MAWFLSTFFQAFFPSPSPHLSRPSSTTPQAVFSSPSLNFLRLDTFSYVAAFVLGVFFLKKRFPVRVSLFNFVVPFFFLSEFLLLLFVVYQFPGKFFFVFFQRSIFFIPTFLLLWYFIPPFSSLRISLFSPMFEPHVVFFTFFLSVFPPLRDFFLASVVSFSPFRWIEERLLGLSFPLVSSFVVFFFSYQECDPPRKIASLFRFSEFSGRERDVLLFSFPRFVPPIEAPHLTSCVFVFAFG